MLPREASDLTSTQVTRHLALRKLIALNTPTALFTYCCLKVGRGSDVATATMSMSATAASEHRLESR
jgi:hypothetical protein